MKFRTRVASFDHGAFDPRTAGFSWAHTERDCVEVTNHDASRHVAARRADPMPADPVRDVPRRARGGRRVRAGDDARRAQLWIWSLLRMTPVKLANAPKGIASVPAYGTPRSLPTKGPLHTRCGPFGLSSRRLTRQRRAVRLCCPDIGAARQRVDARSSAVPGSIRAGSAARTCWSDGAMRNHATYSAGRNTSVRRVAITSPPITA